MSLLPPFTRSRRPVGAPAIDEPLLAAVVRPIIYLCATFVFAFPLATPKVAGCLALAAGAGALVGRALSRSRLRLLPMLLGGLALLALFGALRSQLLQSDMLAAWLGPSVALSTVSALVFGACACVIAAFVRALALRRRPYRALEVAFVGAAFAQLVAAHRGGAINRPFELADSIIARGGDPTLALLAVGAIAAFASVLLLLSEQRPWRSLLHLVLAVGLLSLVLASTRMLGLPQAKAGDGLGLRPKQDKGDGKQGQRRPGGGKGGKPQNSEELDFRDNYDSEGRQVPLAVVLLHDDYSPPHGLYYFRQGAFSQYNGKRLVQATRSDVDRDIAPGFVFAPTHMPEVPNAHGYRVTLETTVAMLADHNRPFALESPSELEPEQNPDPGRFRRTYRVVSEALSADYDELIGSGVGDPNWSAEQRAHYVQAPSDPRYAELAAKIVAGMPSDLRDDPVARGFMVSLWLGHEGIYSLKSGHASAADPTADFLFGDKTGYCVHFAHAAAYLMRALGVPARVASGYVVEESARQGGSAILLSGANSHAWPEMYVTGVGWVIADISPERSLDPPVSAPDPDLQRLLGEMARGDKPLPQGEEKLLEPVAEFARALRFWLTRVLLVVLPLMLVLGYAVKLWRRLSPVFAPALAAPRLAYRADLDRLSEARLSRRFGESREAFAARLAAQVPSFVPLTRAHIGARFAAHPVLDRPGLRQLSRAVQSELSRAVPWSRRMLGALNPFSWFSSR
jgi:transglutaminase-like putative cysteine protease